MAVGELEKSPVGVSGKRYIRRDGLPEPIPGANPMEPLGKDNFAASGNAVGEATGRTIDKIMKVVKSAEVAIATIITAGAVVGGAAVGLLVGGPKAVVPTAKGVAIVGGGVGMFAAGVTMINDKHLNTYYKTLAIPMLLSAGTGLAFGTGYKWGDTASIQAAMRGAVDGVKVGSAVGVVVSAIATTVKGVVDVVKTFGNRLGAD